MLSDVDKKRLFNQLIEKIEIYGEKNESGRWVKSLTFKLTLIDEDINLSLDNDSSVESVVLMSKAD